MRKKLLALFAACTFAVSGLAGCSSQQGTESAKAAGGGKDAVTIVWYPNESGGDMEDARNEIGKLVEKATGKKVENKLTTDYSVAIESIANGTGDIAFMGAEGYIEAHAKNAQVIPLVIESGKSGTKDDALYYSWIAVNKEDASKYKNSGEYSIDKIEGTKMSFVSNSSTSGFKVPLSNIINHFSDKNLTQEDLMEGGDGKFFKEVMYGGSHQGSAVNLLSGKSETAAFCDINMKNYVDLTEGSPDKAGAEYKIKEDAEDPFTSLRGKEFTVISSTPVLNAPFAVNKSSFTDEEVKKLQEVFTSDETAQNKKIFLEENSNEKGFFTKTGDERFVTVEDSWFDPIRNLSK